MSYSTLNTITTVAGREIQVAARNRSIMVSVALTLVLTLGAIGLITWLVNRDDGAPPTVAAVDVPAAAFENSELDATEVPDRAAAETAVREGEADAALVPVAQGWELLAEGSPSLEVSTVITGLTAELSTTHAFAELGIDPAEFAAALPPAEVITVDLSDTGSEANLASVVTVLVGVMILLFTVMLFAGNIGGRVTEEKSSRVVEIILASVRPMDFLAGKIIGNSVFGLIATTIIVGIAAVALNFSGLLDGVEFDWGIVPILLIGFILGMIFFGSLYAAAGALVQRTEDLSSTQMPILLVIMATTYVPLFGWQSLDATWMQVMTWVPPFSVVVAPLQYAAGQLGLVELLGAYALVTLVTIGVIWLVARIYRNAILNNGRKMSWRQALTRK